MDVLILLFDIGRMRFWECKDRISRASWLHITVLRRVFSSVCLNIGSKNRNGNLNRETSDTLW